MKIKILMAECVFVASFFSAWAEPGGTYTLTGEEKGIEEIIKADMAQYPSLYKGVNARSYLSEFKKKNNIGKRKFSPGDVLYFPDTAASLSANSEHSAAQEEQPEKPDELPLDFKLGGLSEVRQEGSYCVPACGTVIAKFHGIDTDQWQVAKLSSQDSMDNSGTMPDDMGRALGNFGIQFYRIEYKHESGDVDDFTEKTLPQFKEALVHEGPMYISIREIFGGNHGCVVIGYNDKRKKMYFYNPWGDEFNLSYKEVEKYSFRALAFIPPKLAEDKTVDCTSLIKTLKHILPNHAQDIIELRDNLGDSDVSFEYIECNRNDIMNDASKTERLARSEGEKLIDLPLKRVVAILIPQTDDDGGIDYMFIRKSPESEKELLVQRIGSDGWSEPEFEKPRELMRYWTTPVVDVGGQTQWSLPIFAFTGSMKAQQEPLPGHIKTSEARAIMMQYVEALRNNDFGKWLSLMLKADDIDSRTFHYRLNDKPVKRVKIKEIVQTKTGYDICLVFDPAIRTGVHGTYTPSYWIQMLPDGKIKYDIYVQHPIYTSAKKCVFALQVLNRDRRTRYRADDLGNCGIPMFGYDKSAPAPERHDSLLSILEWLQDEGKDWDLTDPKVPLAEVVFKDCVLLERYSAEVRASTMQKW